MEGVIKQIIVSLLLGISVTASAHHSRSEFDERGEITELSGEVVSVRWRNPHIEFRLRTVGQDGSVEQWRIAAGNATAAGRMGLKKDTLQPGFKIKVAGVTSMRRANRMVAGQYLLPSGLEVLIDPQITRTPRWSPQRYIDRRHSTYEPSGSLPDDDGIFRVWARERTEEFWMFQPGDYFPLTESARTVVASWNSEDPADNQILQCIPPGMPAIVGDPHPIQFVQMDVKIELRMQAFDTVRTIHLEPAEDISSIDPSPLGYSVGRFEGENTLVVTTTRVNGPYLNRRGVPLSEAAEIEERFTVDEAMGLLNYVMKVTDPVYLSEPFVEELRWFWSKDAFIQSFNCAISG